MSHIFISYSRRDLGFAQKIVDALAANKLDTWIDWKSIPKGEDWEQEIYRGIEEADAFLFLLSPDSVASEMCNKEIEHAVKNGKRILPIVIRDFEYRVVTPHISKLNWLFCREGIDDFDKAIKESRKAIHVDYEWLRFHTELQVKAIRWERHKDTSRLLRGKELREAEQQLAAINVREDPQPTILQREYILASRRAEERVRRQLALGLSFGMIVMATLSVFALEQRNVAISSQATAAYSANIQATAQAQAKTEVHQNQSISQQTEVVSLRATVTYLQGIVQTQSLPSKTLVPGTSTISPTPVLTNTPLVTQATLTPISTNYPNGLIQVLQEFKDAPLFGFVVGVLQAISVILISLLALVVVRSRLGVSRSWLIALASKALNKLPGLGSWAIFFGYGDRLLSEQKDIKRAGQRYFDLPIIGRYDGKTIRLTANDDNQSYIVKVLASQVPVIIFGKGGAGKTTLLARFAYLALTNSLPISLREYIPIFVKSSSYKKGLLDAITTTLRQRDQLAVDEKMVRAQLETRKYLILFDGVSEVKVDKQTAMEEILEFAQSADYKNCRFIISTRPSVSFPGYIPTFELEPLTIDLIENLLPEYLSKPEQFDFVRSQLASFGKKPIEPLLFTMIVEQSDDGNISRTRATLFESYFRHLLGVKDQPDAWEGWSFLLGMFAEWSMLNTGDRGLGLDREELIRAMDKWKGKDPTPLAKLDRLYGLKFESEREILNVLTNTILDKDREYWYFSQDTFEDYFAACRLTYLARHKRWPKLPSWHIRTDQERSFLGVIEFLNEIIFEMGSHGIKLKEYILKKEKSELWKAKIKEET